MLIFRQLFDPQSSTYTYLLGDSASREAILIDPVFEQARRDNALLRELGLTLTYTLDTHVHADHVTGAWMLKQMVGSKIALSALGGASGVDVALKHGDRVAFGERSVEARSTPGHTNGCMTYVLDDKSKAFTGDCLLIRGCGRTDFQQGSPHKLYRSVHEQLFSLPDNSLLYPGHDYRGLTATSVGEERKFNPRVGENIGEDDFVGYMKNLGLPHPKLMDIAVPANLKCGEAADFGGNKMPDWAPLSYTFAGIWEISPNWVEENTTRIQIVDVREPDEFGGPLGHIPGAKLIPLGDLAGKAGELETDKPVVAVCRSGSRSAQATVILGKSGFKNVANLAGGMLRWRAEGHGVDGGAA
jgi:glyoxylase-like metal-dependent hydrolase (beta-lactamase superfamily II)/rhodanese-related sulfurtransferase